MVSSIQPPACMKIGIYIATKINAVTPPSITTIKGSINFVPPFATITLSRTILLTLIFLRELITYSITLVECNIPILIASGLISLAVNKI